VPSPIAREIIGPAAAIRRTIVCATQLPPAPPFDPVRVPVLPVVGWSASASAELGASDPPPEAARATEYTRLVGIPVDETAAVVMADAPLLPKERTTMAFAATDATAGALTVDPVPFAPVTLTMGLEVLTPAYAVMPPTAPLPLRSPVVAEEQLAELFRSRQV
jgi:hypothetical protein